MMVDGRWSMVDGCGDDAGDDNDDDDDGADDGDDDGDVVDDDDDNDVILLQSFRITLVIMTISAIALIDIIVS